MNVRVLKNDGFTLIELILVVILVGIVAAVAIPRFADLSDEAHNANTQATSQAFQAATVFVHSAWIARGRSGSTVQLVGATVDVNSAGWPGHNVPPALNNADCVTIWGAILQNAPPSNVGFVAGGDGWGGDWCQ